MHNILRNQNKINMAKNVLKMYGYNLDPSTQV